MTPEDRAAGQALSAELNALTPDIMAGVNGRIASDLRSIEAQLAAAGVPTGRQAPHQQAPHDPGRDRSTEWEAEDGWLIGYSTARIVGGRWEGKFLVTAHKPIGPGSRKGRGKVRHWEISYSRAFATRAAAKRRAEALYRQHSPRWAAKHPPTNR